ncbi:MAG TPA: hypothetical protein VL332_09730 [Candidatus Saccharimonadaceae bacterium]|nr:hypothetical protein [Candidatus Saccharimonadaceae bacterium]
MDALTEEIEQLKLGSAADTTRLAMRLGLAPAAAKVYGSTGGVSIGGYGEMQFERPDRTRQDDTLSGLAPRADFLRAVIYVGYKFSDELLLNSEMEWEHGGVLDEGTATVGPTSGEGDVALSGEATLEFAYLDWSRHRGFGVRAGKLLVPVGITNEIHEPPMLIGARRPNVEDAILPTTWSGNGAGVYGELPSGWAYRAYVIEGLDASRFSADGAFAEGRQHGTESLFTHPAVTARLDWTGLPGLLVGVSGFRGDAWQRDQPAGAHLAPVVTLWDAHARWQRRGLDARGLWSAGTLADAGALSDALGLTGAERLGERVFGGYLEAAVDLLGAARPGTHYALLPYARFERWSTQQNVPGGREDPANQRRAIVVGTAFKPHPNVSLKAERELLRDNARTSTARWNVALGYLF